MKQYIKLLALLLTIVGGINWLTFSTLDLNLVNYIFGECCPATKKAIYIIIGLSAIYSISLFQRVYNTPNNKSNNKKKITYTGRVKWFNLDKGYGFIKPDNDIQDVFIHITALKSSVIDNLNDNQKIEYEIVEEKGKKSAGNIKLL